MDGQLFRWINELADRTGWAHGFFTAIANYGIVLFAALLLVSYLDGRRHDDLPTVAATVWAGGAALIALGIQHLAQAAAGDDLSVYHLQAGIAACHCLAADYAPTAWPRILSPYAHLALRAAPPGTAPPAPPGPRAFPRRHPRPPSPRATRPATSTSRRKCDCRNCRPDASASSRRSLWG